MEKIEFYLWDGKVRYRVDGEEYTLTQSDRQIIEFVLDTLEKFFPEALKTLNKACHDSARNKYYYDFRRVELFVRCNFGSHDTLNFDINNGYFHFEDVNCPLRGICPHENIICKPRFKMSVPDAERKVAVLYSKGMGADEIARVLRKSIKTVKNQLSSITRRLHLHKTKDLIKIFSVYNGFTLWE